MIRAARFILETFGLPGAGLIFMLEGLGAPLPVEVPLWIIGTRMTSGSASYWQMCLLMWLTTVIGNSVGYFAGYYGGRPAVLKLLQWFRVKPETWERMETWFRRHGLKVVVATRWTNWGFAQNMWLCGITRVPFRRFFTVMVLNDFLWAMAWTWVARAAVGAFWRHGLRFLHASTLRVGAIAVALMLIGLVVVGGTKWMRSRRASGQ
ncbi:MAG TPA: VTT domain-containing protein [Symbiobacteriaceae bacterium]|nr:VTT domain-containing protein [Symbiobacteriaceae bacterium]